MRSFYPQKKESATLTVHTRSGDGKKGAVVLAPRDDNRGVVVQMNEFPREGKYRLRIKAASLPPSGREKPGDHRPARMTVRMGARTKGSSGAEVVIADIDVDAPINKPRYYFFEDYFLNRDVPLRNIEYGRHIRLVIQNARPRPPKNKSGKREDPPGEPAYSSLVIYEIEFDGPYLQSWPPPHHLSIMGDAEEETGRAGEPDKAVRLTGVSKTVR